MDTLHPSQRRYFNKRTQKLLERIGHIGKVLLTPRRLDDIGQETYAQTKEYVEDLEAWAENFFADVDRQLWKTKGHSVRTPVVSVVPSEVLALKITRAKRYLGKTKSGLLSQWLAMDATLLGATKNEIDFFGTVHWMKQESIANVRAYVSGLRGFYAKRAS